MCNIYDERLLKDIEIATQCIIDALKEKPIAIVLCGGYGRGEGVWYFDDRGELSPYNDYDFAVISKEKLSQDVCCRLRKEIAGLVGIKWIDIDFYEPKKLKFLLPTIKNVDLIQASHIVYGDKNIFDKCIVNPKRIGKADIVKLHMTRLWTFLGAWEGRFRDLNSDESFFFCNQMCKAVFAAVDMYLIKNQEYDSFYLKRTELIKEKIDDTQTKELIDWAYKTKTFPNRFSMTKNEMENLYWQVRKLYMKALEETCPFFNRSLWNTILCKIYVLTHSKYLLHIIKNEIWGNDHYFRKCIDVFLAQNEIFLANQYGEIDDRRLLRASNLLEKWGYHVSKEKTWDSLRKNVAYARNNIV